MDLPLNLPISAFASVDKHIRLKMAIKARRSKLRNYFKNEMNADIDYSKVLSRHLAKLDKLQSMLLLSSSMYKEVYKKFKRLPKNFAAHAELIFGCSKKDKYDPRMFLKILMSKLVYFESINDLVRSLRLNKEIKTESDRCDFMDGVMNGLADGTRLGRKAELVRRLSLEVQSRYSEGWYFIFNTLTVNNESMKIVFPHRDSKRSSAWTDYVRAVDRCFAEASYGSFKASLRAVNKEEYHSYFGVVEKGSKSGRLHIHVLHCFRDLPGSFSDPNAGAIVPYKRVIDGMRGFWKFGHSSPIAVRLSSTDRFGKAGWRYPVKDMGINAQPRYVQLPCKEIGAVVGYLTKYITKAVLDKEKGCIWRTRLSRGLGQGPIKSSIEPMSLRNQLVLLGNPQLKIPLLSTKVPRILLRRLLLLKLKLRHSVWKELVRRVELLPPESLLKRLNDMTRGICVFSRRSLGSIRIRRTRAMAVFSHFKVSSFSIPLAGPSYV